MKEGKNRESLRKEHSLKENSKCKGSAWEMVYFTKVIETMEEEVVETVRGGMTLDVKGCCQNIGLHSKNNMKLLKSFIFLD